MTDEPKKYDGDIRKLFIGGIPNLTTFSEFQTYFRQFGEITDIMLPTKTKDSKLNSGFGFVTFRHPQSASQILNTKINILFAQNGFINKVDVKIAKPRNSDSPNAKKNTENQKSAFESEYCKSTLSQKIYKHKIDEGFDWLK